MNEILKSQIKRLAYELCWPLMPARVTKEYLEAVEKDVCSLQKKETGFMDNEQALLEKHFAKEIKETERKLEEFVKGLQRQILFQEELTKLEKAEEKERKN